MRKTIFRSRVLVLVGIGALAGPCLLTAQATSDTARSHVVRPGDTLWSLARVYLGDPWQWRELLRLNPAIAGDPTQLKVGDRIVVGGGISPTPVVREESPPSSATPVRAFASPGSAPAPAPPPNLDSSAVPTRTIFFAAPAREVRIARSPVANDALTDSIDAAIARMRLTDFIAAPYLMGASWSNDPGRAVVNAADRIAPGTIVTIAAPRGYEAVAGARFLTYRLGPTLDAGRVIIPTGMVSALSAALPGEMASGRVEAIFDAAFPGDGLMPLETVIPTTDLRPTRLISEIVGRVLWSSVRGDSASPTRVVILDVGSQAGVRVGDRVLVTGDVGVGSGGAAGNVPGAVGMVVRLGARGASAILVHGIAEVATGSRVRVVPVLP
jgi:hypothetical protein